MKMSNRAKNFRRRGTDSADATADDKPFPSQSTTINNNNKPQILTTQKPRPHKPEGPNRLSFAEDDAEEEDTGPFTAPPCPVPTRTRPSATAPAVLHKLKDRSAPPLTPLPSNVQPQAGEYTKERLLLLQKNTRSLGSSTPKIHPPSAHKPELPTEPLVVFKGLLKPSAHGKETLPTQRQELVEEEDEDVDVGIADSKQFAKLGIGGKGRGDSSAIPDQAMIKAIRAKRERQRLQQTHTPDYISLDGSGVMSTRPTGGGSSDEEDNEFRGRVSLFKDNDGAVKKGVFEETDEMVPVADARVVGGGFEGVDEDDEDEEERKWEEEQLRKAGIGKVIDVATHRGTNNVPAATHIQPQPAMYPGVVHQALPQGSSVGVATWGAEVMSIPQQAEVATRALQESINRLKETHNRTMMSLNKTDENISEALTDITALEKSLEVAGEKYIFMQQLRDFISVMCDFLKDKASLIEELEEQMQKLHEERASAVEERRAGDMADEAREMDAAVSAAISVLSKGSGSAYISAATTAAQAAAAAAKESLNLPVQLDEYGRDTNLQKRMDYTRRAEARKQRRARSESKRMSFIGKSNEYKHTEGELSTDESDSESSAYQSSRDELLKTAAQIFSDAADEYSNLSIVKERFERFKKLYFFSYRDAYMSLSAPAVFSPFVRLELLNWDPLHMKTEFRDMDWYNELLYYGLPEEDKSFDTDDADEKLVPELVEKVALPILHHKIEHCWDVLNTQRTEKAVFAAEMVMIYIPLTRKALHELLAVIHSRLAKAITSLDVPTWNSVVLKAVPGAAQYAAYRFGMSVRLLRNICLWKGLLPLPLLEKLALEDLLVGKLLPYVRSSMSSIHDAITRTQKIVSSLSGVWFGPNVTGDHSQKLQPLVECVAELGRKLEKRHAAGVSEEETTRLARCLKAMLVHLNEYDKARAMLKTFQLKEAL